MNLLVQIFTAPFSAAAGLGRWFLGLTLAGKIAVAVALFQAFLVTLAVAVIVLAGGIPVFQAWWTIGKVVALLLLLFLVPALVFLAARLWLQHDVARWPDIDNAWSEARGNLERQAIDIRTTPLFLVVGLDGRDDEQTLMSALPGTQLVKGAPAGSAPLHAYASDEAVFVSLSGVGATCALLNGGAMPVGTAAHAETVGDGATAPVENAWRGNVAPRSRLDDNAEQEAAGRLRTLCEWLETVRQPVAAINGVVVTVPFGDGDPSVAAALGAAVSTDLQTIFRSVGLRAPVTIAWRGLEGMPGFGDLVTTIPAHERQAALGTAWPTGLPATHDQAHDLAVATCGAVIDKVSDHLLMPQSVQQPAVNRSLIELVCRLRLTAGTTMATFLQRVVALADPSTGPPPIAGSYFVAGSSGSAPDCFVRGMLDRVIAVQGELEWNRRRLQHDRSCQILGRVLALLDVVFLIGVVGVIWWRLAG
jgi:hypothetical protein